MNEYIIDIQNPCKINIKNGVLHIHLYKQDAIQKVAIIDIAVLIISNKEVTITSLAIAELSNSSVIIIFTDKNLLPVSICSGKVVNTNGSYRPFLQAKYIDTTYSQNWHKQLIQSKVTSQAFILDIFACKDSFKLLNLSKKVKEADSSNIEAQASRIFWSNFFTNYETTTKRVKQGATDIINISLNYGYTIIRAMVARAIFSYSLHSGFGIIHIRKDNPYNLVEDFIEPFRFICEQTIFRIFDKKDTKNLIFDKYIKQEIINTVLNATVKIQDKDYRILSAIDKVIVSFCQSLETPNKKLLLPFISDNRQKQSENIEQKIYV
ncbi:type II CRISPR-associated endonuclease Cas1 [Halarcobacter anaerophilus]|uniref:CRISPR-associated endonuclease Cas1 n=1 Tax=Halarcobacter anaerophilus TaxID=877500 RepID=A0A4Q0XZW9_9BACT|nr:type II CRISPR-associated endonuclease Cas1 [Halarcobacter anaerophilus]QDF28548.1 CRISPR/Cas system-associated endonuclease Cas1, type II-C [Halarcobacter anaerophilus]RXJ63277.1 hypothetical protein CRV06_06250 [Halarcobacter anaerophilus]